MVPRVHSWTVVWWSEEEADICDTAASSHLLSLLLLTGTDSRNPSFSCTVCPGRTVPVMLYLYHRWDDYLVLVLPSVRLFLAVWRWDG